MKKIGSRVICYALSLAMLLMMSPAEVVFATTDENIDKAEASVQTEASAFDNEAGDDTAVEQNLNRAEIPVTCENGSLQYEETENTITGSATADAGYALATVRCITAGGDIYIAYEKAADGSYTFSLDKPEEEYELTATFYNLNKWDGAVDLTWYDPSKTSFDISTPAQLAGLAAIVNGLVDRNVTREDQIIDNEDYRTVAEDGSFKHKYLTAKAYNATLTEVTGGQVQDNLYRLPQLEKEIDSTGVNIIRKVSNSNLNYDMRYVTINIVSDLDMTGANYVPIGGKYAMDTRDDAVDPITIDTRFQGVIDGHGHTVKLNCDRYTSKGYAYSMNIGFVGYLGGGVDFKDNHPKDCEARYEDGWMPAVRNVVIEGSVYGRRMVAGVVGHTGEVSTGTIVENCVNRADITNTDMRGAAGIVAAPWGTTTIRNCYNRGDISAQFTEAGGIVGCNGYNYRGADIYNCYSTGTVTTPDKPERPRGIGHDGSAYAPAYISNCFYLSETEDPNVDGGYYTGGNNLVVLNNVRARSSAAMKDAGFIDELNTNGNAYVEDVNGINDGYPVLWFENNTADGMCTVSVESSENGVVTASATQVKKGSIVDFSAKADQGYRLASYSVNGKQISDDFYTVTGDIVVKGNFSEVSSVMLKLPANDEYEYVVTRIYNAATQSSESELLKDGDTLHQGDEIRCNGRIEEGREAVFDANLEYSGKFKAPYAADPKTAVVKGNDNYVLTVTGEGDVMIVLTPRTRGKQWTSIADTSWYDKDETVYEIGTPNELAGMAKLMNDGVENFKGKTIKLTDDISLLNNDGSKGRRNWTQAGNANPDGKHCFKGTFDGQGHSITDLNRDFAGTACPGSNGGLFGVVDGATIKNVKVSGYFEKGADTSAGIAGTAKGKTVITNCHTNMKMLDAGADCAGIVGKVSDGTIVISDCTSAGSLKGNRQCAGIVASVGSSTKLTVSNCTNSASIELEGYNAAGIIAYAQYAQQQPTVVTIKDCVNEGEIGTRQTNTSSVSDGVAGIIASSDAEITINRCVNKGNITAAGTTSSCAGIAAYLHNKQIVKGTYRSVIYLTNCYNTGVIASLSESSNAAIAGIANFSTDKSVLPFVENCYNSGAIAITNNYGSDRIGACISRGNYHEGIRNNYYLYYTAPKAGIDDRCAEAVSKDQLKNLAPSLGSEYAEDKDGVNSGYPVHSGDIFTAQNPLRVAGSTRYDTSLKIAEKLLAVKSQPKYDAIVVAYGGNYPDALAGGYFASELGAPLITVNTTTKSEADVLAYIKANLKSNGKVYILGDVAVVTSRFEKSLSAYDVERVAGKTRLETNIEILKRVDCSDGILVCNAYGYADSLSASATGKPILLVTGTSLNKDQVALIQKSGSKDYTIIGGSDVVKSQIENSIKKSVSGANVKRLAGATRYQTSTMVAKEFFPEAEAVVIAYGKNFPDGLSGGPLAMELNAPLVLATSTNINDAKAYFAESGAKKLLVLGSSELVSDSAALRIMGR